LLDDDEAWAHPVVRQTFPAGLRDAVMFVHAHRERLYQISESLPRTLCHLDFWPKNLFSRPGGPVVVIDWSFAGVGAIGEDAGNLVPDSALDHFIAASDLPRLEQVVFDGYLRGLRAAGWDEDPRLVQLGMWSSAVKYDWLAALTLAQVRQDRQYRYGGAGEIDPVLKFRERSRVLFFNARWARQAVELAARLGL
jgi:thiamine kinase-like enzyme